MIIGIGVDLVDLARFERAASRTPRLVERLFAESEQVPDGRRLSLRSLAARFAAKEALIKAIGDSDGMRWHDVRIVSNELRNPSFELSGRIAQVVAEHGITRLHLSMSHDAGVAVAYVVAEGDPR
ncbi:holo-[acyl-carrier protein] synthase [Homoserinimonas aerilata]|uniref:Holo-[acyl-carrier-protein] synthase n=1 Tax=Homoserinimonas aerilata TaxID=1162970 RepID=A0A542YLE4_9MICO|nr:holo-ACP synthase [Homoserinimonas aerilata]TQL48898.1 holo-[acyl-carrier protein] synthase [Homoserinimonas aerilata]